MEVYIENARLNQMAKAIAALEPCPFTGRVTADQIKVVLGEKGNIWPASILPDALKTNSG